MTNQELFDRVVTHARQQKCKAEVETTDANGNKAMQCAYRTPSGNKCFMGALIPDEKYSPTFEGIGLCFVQRYETDVRFALARSIAEAANITPEQYAFAWDVQKIHDRVSVQGWEQAFAKIAKYYNLTYTPPQPE